MFGIFGHFSYLYVVTKVNVYETNVCSIARFILQRFNL